MSTKIYEGYRLKQEGLNRFLVWLREAVYLKAEKRLLAAKDELQNKGHTKSYKEFIEQYSWKKEEDYILYMAEEASKSATRDPSYDIDFGLNLWKEGAWYYFIPYGESYTYAGLEYPDYCEDFSYWDNVDAPEDVSEDEWANRRDTWNRVCLNGWNSTRLLHEVISMKDLSGTGYDYTSEFYKRQEKAKKE